uniref:aldehyde dehydrogenase family protein n=1 Tax=Rhodococcus qingshengii TaxID=334542 RepID=UPI001C4DF2EF|nr:aldehyde dehydrogenase family protein [Rhodococcus qingshengii]
MRTLLDSELLHRDQLYVNGRWTVSNSTDRIEVENPATEQVVGTAPSSSPDDIDAAVESAAVAFDSWSVSSVSERRAVLERFGAEMISRREELASLVTHEMGTPIELSRVVQADLPVAVLQGVLESMASLEQPELIGNSRIYREPVGVVAAITPWNYPIHQAVSKLAAALAAGCTVVLKPSEVTPLSAYLLADCAQAAGVPDGVVNIVTGSRDAGAHLAAHPLIDAVSFTGSTNAGRHIMSAAADTIRRVSLELGGKSANVLLEDGDLEQAVRRGVQHVMENSGQTCTAWTRMIVPARLQDEVVDVIRDEFQNIVVGDPWDVGTTMGPLANRRQKLQYERYVTSGRQEGAKVAAHRRVTPTVGHFVEPIAFCDVDNRMTIAREEVFGPLLSVIPYRDEAEALRIANDSIYGLSGAVWSSDAERALFFARRMQTGQVSVNGGKFNPAAPFGGFRQSGLGRELGRHGLEDFTEMKAVQL